MQFSIIQYTFAWVSFKSCWDKAFYNINWMSQHDFNTTRVSILVLILYFNHNLWVKETRKTNETISCIDETTMIWILNYEPGAKDAFSFLECKHSNTHHHTCYFCCWNRPYDPVVNVYIYLRSNQWLYEQQTHILQLVRAVHVLCIFQRNSLVCEMHFSIVDVVRLRHNTYSYYIGIFESTLNATRIYGYSWQTSWIPDFDNINLIWSSIHIY